jgi:hypothetical protein
MHHHSGRGGRVIPLYRNQKATAANITPRLIEYIEAKLSLQVAATDLIAYIAAISSHSGYTTRFRNDLQAPGVRIPLTTDGALWRTAVEIGREVLWLHTFGERFTDAKAGRRPSTPKLPSIQRPKVQVTIPDTEDGMPDTIDYDADSLTLKVGSGRISPVPPEVWDYHVSGMRIIKHWFGYRKKTPTGSRKSELDHIIAPTWTPAMTTELLNLLNVLGRCIELEPNQAELLDNIAAGPQITVDELEEAGVLPASTVASKPPKPTDTPSLWDD